MVRFFIPNFTKILAVGVFLIAGCQNNRATKYRLYSSAENIELLAEIEKDTLLYGDETGIHYSIKNLSVSDITIKDARFLLAHSINFFYFPPNEKMFRKKLIFEFDSLTIKDSFDGYLIINIDSNFFDSSQNELILLLNGQVSVPKNTKSLIQAESGKMGIYIKPTE